MPIDFRLGDVHPSIVFLGACPGQAEFRADPQRPFAGRAGQNLVTLLDVLRAGHIECINGNVFDAHRIDDYTLLNAFGTALWHARDNRSLPNLAEVETDENMTRLREHLRACDANIVIGLGAAQRDTAPMRAIRRLHAELQNIEYFITGHPSPLAIAGHANGDAVAWFQGTFRRFPNEARP